MDAIGSMSLRVHIHFHVDALQRPFLNSFWTQGVKAVVVANLHRRLPARFWKLTWGRPESLSPRPQQSRLHALRLKAIWHSLPLGKGSRRRRRSEVTGPRTKEDRRPMSGSSSPRLDPCRDSFRAMSGKGASTKGVTRIRRGITAGRTLSGNTRGT